DCPQRPSSRQWSHVCLRRTYLVQTRPSSALTIVYPKSSREWVCSVAFRPISSLSFPRHHFGMGEAPQYVWMLAARTPGSSNIFKLKMRGDAIFYRFFCNGGVQCPVGICVGPFPRCGRIRVGHSRCCNMSFDKTRLAEPMSKMASGVRLAAVATC